MDQWGASFRPRAYNRSLMASITRSAERQLWVRIHLLDAWRELSAELWVGSGDFRIQRARTITHREKQAPLGSREVPELVGLEAYAGAGRRIRSVVEEWPGGACWFALFMEGVKVLIEAEYFLAAERGLGTGPAYDIYFAEKFPDSCLYYTVPLEEAQPWTAYVGEQFRDHCPFMRYRNTVVTLGPECRVMANVNDTFQNLMVLLDLEPDFRVKRAETRIIRLPHEACFSAVTRVERLIGSKLDELDRRQLNLLLGGREGCIHLEDVAAEVLSLVGEVSKL